jgi:hypothetical protein
MTNKILLVAALIPLLILAASTVQVNAQSQTTKACINQELKNLVALTILLQATGHTNNINQTLYDIGTNVIMKCMGK